MPYKLGHFNRTRKLRYVMNDVYYWFSLLFLIGRTVTLFLCAAHINEAAKKPLDIVTKIPNNGWSVEVNSIELSGLQ